MSIFMISYGNLAFYGATTCDNMKAVFAKYKYQYVRGINKTSGFYKVFALASCDLKEPILIELQRGLLKEDMRRVLQTKYIDLFDNCNCKTAWVSEEDKLKKELDYKLYLTNNRLQQLWNGNDWSNRLDLVGGIEDGIEDGMSG
jgi:hypothetical protein